MDLDETTRLYKIRKTVLQMLEDRGYVIPPSQMEESLDNFKQNFQDRRSLLIQTIHKETQKKMMVYFEEDEKIKVKNLIDIFKLMYDQHIFDGILVYKKEITSSAKKLVEEQTLSTLNLELFQEKELLVNITKHELVPRHFPIGDQDKKDLLEKYKVKESQLPKILHTDPVARYYGLKKSQVVKILRDSETAGKYVTYRLVV